MAKAQPKNIYAPKRTQDFWFFKKEVLTKSLITPAYTRITINLADLVSQLLEGQQSKSQDHGSESRSEDQTYILTRIIAGEHASVSGDAIGPLHCICTN